MSRVSISQQPAPGGAQWTQLYLGLGFTTVSFTGSGPVFPEMEGIRQGAGNESVIGVKVQPGATHQLQYSTDLKTWETIQTFKGEGLRMDLTVTRDATGGKGFWRVVR